MFSPRIALAAFFGGCLALALAAGPAQEAATVRAEPVAGSISVLFGEGGNIGVSSGADGILIVDGQFERLAPEIEQALAKLAQDPARAAPRFLVNTHHHDDHTDGNKRFGKVAVVVAHENVRKRMEAANAPAQALPVVTYGEGGASLHWNGEEVRLIHVPSGHTDGDTAVWFTGSKVVHLGDLYFQAGYPFIDTGAGGNVLGMIEGLRALLGELPADVRIVPGHGVVTGREGLEEYLTMLESITERVRERLEKDVAAMLAAGVTRDFDERWGKSAFVTPERFVRSVVASLR